MLENVQLLLMDITKAESQNGPCKDLQLTKVSDGHTFQNFPWDFTIGTIICLKETRFAIEITVSL